MSYELHPLAELIPPMSDEEFADLLADVRANGLRSPITLYEEKVLDGRHRLRACEELGIAPATASFDGDDPTAFVISMNLRRRNLTTGQRATAALALLDYEKARAKERQGEHARTASRDDHGYVNPSVRPSEHTRAPSTREERRRAVNEAGSRLGVSGKSVERARRVAADDPQLHEQVKRGEVSLTAAHEEVRAQRDRGEALGKREAGQQRQMLDSIAGKCLQLSNVVPHVNLKTIGQLPEEERAAWLAQLRQTRTHLSQLIRAL